MVKGARKECPNCGYEALGNYCSMCGTKLIADEEIIVSSNMNQEQQNFFSRFKKRLNDEFIAIEKSTNLTPDEKVNRIIGTTSALCAGIAIQPIPFADMPILTSIQAYMGYKIGQVRGVNVAEEGAWEVLKAVGGVIGLGFAAQQIAIGLYKLGLPGLGGFMSIPLVAGLTFGIGKAMDVYFIMQAQGRTPTPEEIKRTFNQGKKEGKKIKPKQ